MSLKVYAHSLKAVIQVVNLTKISSSNMDVNELHPVQGLLKQHIHCQAIPHHTRILIG